MDGMDGVYNFVSVRAESFEEAHPTAVQSEKPYKRLLRTCFGLHSLVGSPE
jgi:hypothetical protein